MSGAEIHLGGPAARSLQQPIRDNGDGTSRIGAAAVGDEDLVRPLGAQQPKRLAETAFLIERRQDDGNAHFALLTSSSSFKVWRAGSISDRSTVQSLKPY